MPKKKHKNHDVIDQPTNKHDRIIHNLSRVLTGGTLKL